MHPVVVVQEVQKRELSTVFFRLFIQVRITRHTVVGFMNLLINLLQAGIGIHDNLVATEQAERLVENLNDGLFRPDNTSRGVNSQNVMNRFLCGDERQVIIAKTRTSFECSFTVGRYAVGNCYSF